MTRKSKVIATLGNSTDSILEKIVDGGADAVLIDTYYGEEEENVSRIEKIKQLREKLNKNTAIIYDLDHIYAQSKYKLIKIEEESVDFACKHDVDFIACPFVSNIDEIRKVKDILTSRGKKDIGLIVKIDCKEAYDNIDEIIEASDSIMVARGDLGLEIPYYDVPYYEKKIIRKCRLAGKQVIVATQMLDSMEKSPLPTRAEVTDVYYAVELGADATMLSGESASGQYPVEAVKTMAKIAQRAEAEYYNELFYNEQLKTIAKNASSRSKIAYEVAKKLKDGKFKFAVILSHTGELLKEISTYRPNAFIAGIVSDNKLVNKYGITSGIFCEQHSEKIRLMIKENHDNGRIALERFNIKKGDNFIVVDSLNITEHIY